jgi:hypothetical protein
MKRLRKTTDKAKKSLLLATVVLSLFLFLSSNTAKQSRLSANQTLNSHSDDCIGRRYAYNWFISPTQGETIGAPYFHTVRWRIGASSESQIRLILRDPYGVFYDQVVPNTGSAEVPEPTCSSFCQITVILEGIYPDCQGTAVHFTYYQD